MADKQGLFITGWSQLQRASEDPTPFCAWSDDYLVGVQRMDKQHRALIATLNKLHDVLMRHGDQALVDELLADLIRQTKVHFRTEEEYMQAYDYPDYRSHKELHDILLCQIEGVLETQQELEARHIRQPWDERLELADFLREWLLSHIVDADKKLGDFLKDKKLL